jgi:hypothetical protein
VQFHPYHTRLGLRFDMRVKVSPEVRAEMAEVARMQAGRKGLRKEPYGRLNIGAREEGVARRGEEAHRGSSGAELR